MEAPKATCLEGGGLRAGGAEPGWLWCAGRHDPDRTRWIPAAVSKCRQPYLLGKPGLHSSRPAVCGSQARSFRGDQGLGSESKERAGWEQVHPSAVWNAVTGPHGGGCEGGPARRCRPHRKAPSPPQQRQKCHNPSSRHGQDVGTWAVFKLVPADAGWPRWCACPAEVPTSSPGLCHTANIWKQGSSSRGWLAGPPHGLLSPVESPPPPRHHCPLLQEQVLPDLPGASAAAPGGDPCSAAAMLGGGGDPRPSTPTSRSESSEPEWRPARLRHPVVTGNGATPQSQPHP